MAEARTSSGRTKTAKRSGKTGPLVLKDKAPVPLPKTGTYWRVENGPLTLYCQIGTRRHRLAKFEDGQVFPNPPNLRKRADLLVSGDAGTTLKSITARQIADEALIASADELIKGLAELAARTGSNPDPRAAIAAPGAYKGEDDKAALVSPGKVVWLEPQAGAAIAPCGLKELADTPAHFPLCGGLWAQIFPGATAILRTSTELAKAGTLKDALKDHLTALPGLIEALERVEDERVLATIAANEQDMADQVSRGLAELEAVGPGAKASGMEGEADPAMAAVRFALKSLGKQTETRNIVRRANGLAAVPEIARTFGARTRQIILSGEWWKEDLGAIVARQESGREASDENIVALVRKGGTYRIHAPLQRDDQTVNADIADTIHGQAFAIYPPLPAKITGLRDIAMFLLPIISADMRPLILTGLIIGLLGMIVPMATALIFDSLIPGSEISLLIQVGIGLAVAALLVGLMSLTKALTLLRINGRSASMLHAALWDRLLKLPTGFFKSYSAGDLNQRIGGFESIRSAVLSVVLSAALTAIFSIFYLGLLFFYDVKLALIGLALVIVLTAITFIVGLMQIKYLRKAAAISGLLSGFVFQLLQGIVKLRVAGAEARGFARWAGKYAEERRAIISVRNINNHFGAFADAYAILSLAAIFAAAIYLSDAAFTPGIFIAFIAAFSAFQAAFMGLSNAALSLFRVMPDLERGRPILDAETEETFEGADPGPLSGAISISNITFAYDAGSAPVLQDISLHIAPGEHAAIVGPSGSGKSTLFRILLGFETPQSGTVLYDNQELASLNVAAVRRQIGVVLQTGRIFAGTIFENIRGAGQASLEECLLAAEQAGLSDDLAMFPMGLHTPLTEGASTISGGQRQRILIARALASSPRILFMDEATSALDNRTQTIVTESLNRLSVTRLVIAHRLSTVKNADRIFVIKDGRLVEQGSYDELMQLKGTFAQLAERQLT